MKTDISIIGGGIIGTAIARELSKYKVNTILIEKEEDVAMGTSKANSGIIHAGYNDNFNTLKGKLNVISIRKFDKLCSDLKVPFKRVGSLVIGFDEKDLSKIIKLKEIGDNNKINNIQIIKGDKLFQLEPNLNPFAKYALYAPTAGIISPYELTIAFADNAAINGVRVLLETEAKGIITDNRKVFAIVTNRGLIQTKIIINAAGLYADQIARLVGDDYKIQPMKGEYQLYDKKLGELVNHILFPIPTKFSKGILVAPTVHKNLLIGPNYYPVKKLDDLATTENGIKEVYNGAKKLIPYLPKKGLINSFAGLRASITNKDDFVIEPSKKVVGFINVLGIKSPGLTCCPAIAEMVVNIIKEVGKEFIPKLQLNYKDIFKETLPEKPKYLNYEDNIASWQEIVEKDSDYGEIICRCEKVSKGEIIKAIHQPVPAKSLDAIKRRTRAGMGRCQGGFCSPKVLKIISDELKISSLKITKKGQGSEILNSETKKDN